MEPKDYATIAAVVISSLSFVVSFLSWKQKDSEAKRTVRNQITDCVTKLDTVFAEDDRILNETPDEEKSNRYFLNRRSFLSGQKRFLARQAAFLMKEKVAQDLVMDFEFNRVADAFSSIGEFDLANEYYLKAIQTARKAKNPYYESMYVRAYAYSLFQQGRNEECRQKFMDSISLVKPDSDVFRFHIAVTYQRWARLEADSLNWNEAYRLIEKAKDMYEQILNERRAAQGLMDLSAIAQDIFARHSEASGNLIEGEENN